MSNAPSMNEQSSLIDHIESNKEEQMPDADEESLKWIRYP